MSNVLDIVTGQNSAGLTTISVPDSKSINTTSTTGSGLQTIPKAIQQTERLLTTRSRASQYQTERGQYSYIKILSADPATALSRHVSEINSKPTSIGDASGGVMKSAFDTAGAGYASFLLTGVQGAFDEKVQITEVFGDAEVTYFFGRQPIQMNFSGVLIDSVDNDWFTQWLEMYSHVLRGSQLARNYELVKIVMPNMTVVGTVTRCSWSQDSQRDVDIPFQFTMLVKQVIPAPIVATAVATTDNNVLGSLLPSFTTQSDILSKKSQLDTLIGTIQNPMSTMKDYSSALFPVTSVITSATSASSVSSLLSKVSSSTGAATSTSTSSAGPGNIFSNVSSNLAGIRASLFSPVYGVLSSLTKLIKGVTGTISSVVSSFTTPVKNILRDIRNISNQAIGIVNLVNSGIRNVTNNIRSVDSDLRATLALLKKTSGVISSSPTTITQNLRDLVNAGKLPATRKFLQNNSNGTTLTLSSGSTRSKLTLLNSGARHTPEKGASL